MMRGSPLNQKAALAPFEYSAGQISAKYSDCKSLFLNFLDYLDRGSVISYKLDSSSRAFEYRDISGLF